MRWVVMVMIASGCGRVAFDERAIPPDTLSPSCTWGPFGAPQHVVELGSNGDDWAPRVTGDGLELYLYSSRPGTLGSFDIFVARRSTSTMPWTVPVDAVELNSSSSEATSFVSEDGLTFLVTTDRITPNSSDVWLATRASRAQPFSAPVVISEIMSTSSDGSPWLSSDGLRLYFSSDRLGSKDIFVATRATGGDTFAAPTVIAAISSGGNEREITLSHDELEAFIVADMGGNFDIYRSTRSDLGSPFSTPQQVVELSTSGDELGVSLTADGTTMFFNYNAVAAGSNNSEIYQATRSCL